MAERIGLEAVLDTGNFQRGLGIYTSGITQMNKDTGNFVSTAGSQFIGLGQGILKFGAIAGGVAVGGAAALTAGIVALGFTALDEVSKFERMSLSITNLVAREISGGQVIEQARQGRIQLSEKEAKELEKLPALLEKEGLSRNTLAARIQEQRQRVIDLTTAYGDNGLNVQTARAKLAEMEGQLGSTDNKIIEMNNRVTELNGKQGQLVTTLEKVRVGQMSMTDAMAQATPRAQELIKWIQILGIQSPFTSEGIQKAFQTALAYGFTTEQAQRLTEAEVDFTAATGKSAQAADLIALALGQIQSRGKLSAQELRQLSEQGIGTNRILEDMGFSLDDVSNGLVDTDIFIEAVIKDMEIFKGAAKSQATTFSGLVTSLSEVKAIGLREFFTGTFESIRPYLANFVDFLTKAAFETGSIRALGDVLGQKVGGALATINRWATLISQLGGGAGLTIFSDLFGPQGIVLWGQINTLVGNVADTFSEWSGVLGGILPSFSEFSGGIIPALISGLTFLNQHFEEFKGAMLGIGAVMGGAVFAAVAAGLIGLLTPINLIIAGAALLGAAWAGNWLGIRDITDSVIEHISGLISTFQKGGLFGVGDEGGLLSALGLSDKAVQNIQFRISQVMQLFRAFSKGGLFGTAGKGGLLVALGLDPTVVATIQDIIGTIVQDIKFLFAAFASGDMSAVGQVGELIVNQLSTAFPIIQTFSDAWTNVLLPGFIQVGDAIATNILPLFVQLGDWLSSQGPGATQVLVNFWNGVLLPALAGLGDFMLNVLFPAWVQLQVWMAQNIPVAIQTLAGFWTGTLVPAYQAASDFVTQTLIPGFVGIGTWLTNLGLGIQQIATFWTGVFMTAVTTVWSYLSGTVLPLFQAISEFQSAVWNKAIEAGAGLWQNILYPALLMVGGYIGQQLSPTITALTVLWDILKIALVALGSYLSTQLSPFFITANDAASDIGNTISDKVIPIIDALASVTLVLLSDGLETVTGWIKKATDFFNGLKNAVNSFELPDVLKPGSPPPMAIALMDIANAAQAAGINMSSFTALSGRNFANLYNQLTKVDTSITNIDRLIQGAKDGLSEIGKNRMGMNTSKFDFTIKRIREVISGNVEALKASADPAKLITELVGSAATWKKVGIKKSDAQSLGRMYWDNFIKLSEEARLAVEKMRLEALQMGVQFGGQFAQFGLAAADRLQSRIETLQAIVDSGTEGNFGGQIISATQAQQELNKALADQAAVQQQIVDLQRQQADLQFLQQQISLIQMIKEAGLDVEDILGGITLGLDASLPDIVAAMNNVVQAMIDQIDADLAIQSPSKVMFNKFRQVGLGAAKGIMSTKGILEQAFAPIVQPLLSAGPGVQGAPVNNNTYYDFNMTVNTGASPQGVIRQYSVMAGMLS